MGREGELSSPQNKLKDILQIIFKRNDQQVAGDLIPAQACQEKALECTHLTDAAPAADDAAASQGCLVEPCTGGLQESGAAHSEQQQPRCSSSQRDSASTLDAFEPAAAASVGGPHEGGAVKQHAMRSGAAGGGPANPDCGSGAAGAPNVMQPAHNCAGLQATSGNPQHNAASSSQHHLQATAAAPANAVAQAAPHDSGLPMESPGQQQQQPMQRRAGSSAAVPHACAAATMHSEPCPASSGGAGSKTPGIPRKVLCASVDDLYQELFGDVPLPSTSGSAAHSPFEGSLGNLRGLSSMSPMTTSSAFCHQHAAAAAIAGGGGMPGVGSFMEVVNSPVPFSGTSNRSSFDRNSGGQSPITGGRYGDCGGGMLPAVQPPQPMGDMLPLGAYPPRVRVAVAVAPQPRSTRGSGSDAGSSSLFPEDSPSCCSSSAAGHPWPQEESASCAVSSLSSGQGCESRGSLHYSSPTAAQQLHGLGSSRDGRAASPATAGTRHAGARTPETLGTQSAPGTSDSKPAPKSSLRTRWTNWINSSGGGGGGSSERARSAAQQQLQVQPQPQQQAPSVGQQEPHAACQGHSRGPHSPRRSVLAPQSAPGNAADQALYASTGRLPRAGNSSRAGGVAGGGGGVLPLQPLAHCHSNPELVQAAAFGSVGHGRGQFQRASGLRGGVPPCARSLFGSVPHLERPLVMAGSVGNGSSNNSSGWLSGPGGVGFGVPHRSESFGVLAGLGVCDDAMSVASADDEVIRQVNADNVLSTAWGPGSHSASGGGMPGMPLAASHPKLLAFKYCAATSPLNHPGRSSPFNSARNSPFNSPRGTRDSVVDLLSLRSAAVALVTASCPGSPLGARHSINPFSNSNTSADVSTPAAPGAAAEATFTPSAAAAAAATSGVHGHQQPQQQQQPQQGLNVLKKQGSSSSQVLLEPTASGASDQQQVDGSSNGGSDAGTACSSSGGSNSSSKPPLQGRPLRGLLRTPPPPLPLPIKAPSSLPAAATIGQLPGWAADAQKRCATADAATLDGSGRSSSSANGGRTQVASPNSKPADTAEIGRGAGLSGNRRVSAPAGLSGFMLRFSSSSGSNGSNAASPANDSSSISQAQSPGSATQGSTAGTSDAAVAGALELTSSAGAVPSCSHSSIASKPSERGLPLVLPSCSVDMSSPKQQLQTTTSAGADTRSSPRRQSSSRLGASGGFTTPSRLSHNSTMAEVLVTGSGGGATGGFALQRTSSCCSSSSGWPGAAGGKLVSGGHSSSGVAGLPGHDGALLSTTSVPLPNVYRRGGSRSVNCSDSSDDSWSAGQSGYCPVQEGAPLQEGGPQQHEQAGEGAEWAQGSVACLAARSAAAAGGRYDSGNGASDASVADCQECPYPSWCSSNCWSPLAPQQEQQDPQVQPLQASQQQMQQQQQQGYACPGLQGSAGAAVEPQLEDRGSADAAAVAEAAIPPSLPEVDFLDKIGRGSFGDVFKGVWCGSVVAVKVIQVKQPSALTFPNRPSTQPLQQQLSQQQQDVRLQQPEHSTGAPSEIDSQAAQVALELAQHEYESWLNANLRHPNIVQLFTSFTIGLEERGSSLPGCLFGHPDGESAAGMLSGGGGAAGLSWKTHLVMEYCELGTMQDLLQRGVFSQGSLSGAAHLCWVLATAKEFCTAVSYLHSMDVVHGDLKSSNVLLKAAAATAWDSRGFVAKVSDFGLSRVMDAINAANGDPPVTPPASTSAPSSCSASGAVLAAADAGLAGAADDAAGGSLGWQPCQPRFGALSHAAPELIRGQQLSKASDVYSIGVLLWELLSGQAPFYGMHPGQLLSLKLSQHTSQLLPFPAAAPAGLAQLCLDCWAAEPSQRPSMPTVVQSINDLAVSLLGQEQAVAMFPDVAASLAAQRRQAALAAAAAAAAGVGGCC